MAIIGSIVIGMSANTSALSKSLLGTSGLINQFGASMKLAGWGFGMLAADSLKFARGVAQDFAFVGKIAGKGLGLAASATMAFGAGSMNVLRDVSGMWLLAGKHINKFGDNVYKVGKQLGIALLAGGTVGALALGKMVKTAMSLGEQTDRVRVVFGDSGKEVIDTAQKMGDAFGVSKVEFIKAAGALGSIFRGVGYDKSAASQLSVHFVKLATDLSSLTHIPVEEALEKIQSGLAGQIRPLREVGVFMSEEAVAAYAAANGIAKAGSVMNETQKVQARVGFITNALKDSQGNLALTAGSAANRMRALWGEIDNLSSSIGQSLLPIVGAALSDINTGLQVVQAMWNSSSLAAAEGTIGVVGNAETQTTSIGFIQRAVGMVADAWQSVQKVFLAVQIKITEGLIYMVESVSGFAEGIAKIVSYFTGIELAAGDFTKTWLEDLKMLEAQQLKTFSAKDVAKPFSEGVNQAFNDARAKTAAIRADLAKSTIDVTKLVPKGPEVKEKAEKQVNTAASFGSAEAANAILKSQFGGDQTAKDNKKIADNTGKANVHLADIARAVQGFAGRGGALDWDNI